MRGSHLVANHSLGKTSYEGSCACDTQLDSSLRGSFPSLLPGWDRLGLVLHSLCAPLLPFCVGASLEQASQRTLKRQIYS